MDKGHKGKNYIVTGASSGIGRAVCLALAEEGANVALVGRSEGRLQETLGRMAAGRHVAKSFDLAQIDGIAGLLAGLAEEYGQIDGLAYCAGISGRAKLKDTDYAFLHGHMQVHFYAFVECVRQLSKLKKKARPLRVVGMSSLASETHEKGYIGYAAAKAAMEAAVRAMATELAARATSVSLVRAGFVETPMASLYTEMEGDINELIRKTGYQPLGIIPPEYAADLIVYLLGEGGRYISGAMVPLNGGAPC